MVPFHPESLFTLPAGIVTRWAIPENCAAIKAGGAQEFDMLWLRRCKSSSGSLAQDTPFSAVFILILTILVHLVSPNSVGAQNLLPNANLEEGKQNWSIFVPAVSTAANCTFSIVDGSFLFASISVVTY